MNQPITMKLWAVVTLEGEIMEFFMHRIKSTAIANFCDMYHIGKSQMKKDGYTCKQFEVTFKEVEG